MSLETKLLTIANNEQKVYEAGKKEQYDELWDNIQQNGKRTNYQSGFQRWGNKEIIPKYPIKTTTLYEMFGYCDNLEKIDWNNISPFSEGYYSAYLFVRDCKKIKSVDMDLKFSNYQPNSTFYCSFLGATALERIQKIYSEADMVYNMTFVNCTSLKEIRFEGAIGKSIDFKWSPLSIDSMKNIILHLVNYKDTVYDGVYTLTLSSDSWLLLDNEGATSPNGNSWRGYVNDLGWKTV